MLELLGDDLEASCRESDARLVLPHVEARLKHRFTPEALGKRREFVAPSRRQPEFRARAGVSYAVRAQPDPRNEVAPVVEVKMGDRDRVDLDWTVLSQSSKDAGPAVQKEPTGALDEVAGLSAAWIGPSRRRADNREAHLHILT